MRFAGDTIKHMTEYANRPLIEKLGIKTGMRAIIMRAPDGYIEMLPELGERATLISRLVGRFDFIQYFASSPEQLGAVMQNLASHLEPGGMLWVTWAKRTSPVYTGLTEATVRELGLKSGLVDVKITSMNKDWTGLKFVYRLSDR
jgi:hypothetical protein